MDLVPTRAAFINAPSLFKSLALRARVAAGELATGAHISKAQAARSSTTNANAEQARMAGDKGYWWEGNSEERYWCEITARNDIGEDLHCPQTDDRGKDYWSYSLIKQIRPGELVYHYSITLKAFVGISRANGTLVETTKDWTSRAGTERPRLREHGTRPAWKVPLKGYVSAANPLTLQDVRTDQDWVRAWIEAKGKSGAVAAPFQLYPKQLRANQGYLTKMPAEFVGLSLAKIQSTSEMESRRRGM
jgi:hypothetical protein